MKKRGAEREDLLEAEFALALRGVRCPVCSLAGETERAVVAWLATTNMREEATAAKLVEARGLCARHWTSVLERSAGDLGASGARLLSRIAGAVADDLAARASEPRPACPACVSVSRRERSVLEMLFAALSDPDRVATYRSSDGLCRPHLGLAMTLAPDRPTLTELIESQERALRALARRLDEGARDARARDAAASRVIALLVGSGA